jgi:oxygen-dependent protoporphyrinogen oxidase
VLGAPGRLAPLLHAGVLSPAGIARAGLDLVLPRDRWPADVSVGEIVGRRFGREVVERLVDPLLGGIHAGRVDDLSAESTAPQLAKVARASRSLLLGLRAAAAAPAGPVFLAPAGGMEVLVDRLVARLRAHGVSFRADRVETLRGEKGGRVVAEPVGAFDRAVVAVPAAVAAGLLKAACPDAAEGLAAIVSASVVLVTLAYPAADVDVPAQVSGFLVPAPEGRLMTACSFGSRKWPHWSDPGTEVLRVSAGRAGDDRAVHLDDGEVAERLHGELVAALGVRAPPTAWRVSRWPGSFPQYQVGHGDRVGAVEAALAASLPGVALAGASYRGSGIPACIGSGRRAAASMLA